jgi:hypothetical protein
MSDMTEICTSKKKLGAYSSIAYKPRPVAKRAIDAGLKLRFLHKKVNKDAFAIVYPYWRV